MMSAANFLLLFSFSLDSLSSVCIDHAAPRVRNHSGPGSKEQTYSTEKTAGPVESGFMSLFCVNVFSHLLVVSDLSLISSRSLKGLLSYN